MGSPEMLRNRALSHAKLFRGSREVVKSVGWDGSVVLAVETAMLSRAYCTGASEQDAQVDLELYC
jgi:hypothetical protein